jgi:acyl-CoA thioester hydrolase
MSGRPFRLYAAVVSPEWIDANGHMNVASFGIAFDRAGHALIEELCIGADYVAARRRGLFILEAHCRYCRELKLGDPIEVASRLLAVDDKRVHLFHEMFHGTERHLAATLEVLAVCVDLGARRAVAFEPDVRTRLARVAEQQALLPLPHRCSLSLSRSAKDG